MLRSQKHWNFYIHLGLTLWICMFFGTSTHARKTSSAVPHEKAKGCITGTVRTAQGRPLAGVFVYTQPTSSSKWTSHRGTFSICFRRTVFKRHQIIRKALPFGPYTLHMSKFGFHAQPLSFTFAGNHVRFPQLVMKTLPNKMCIPVSAQRTQGLKQGLERTCWPNGAPQLERHYLRGQLHGVFRFWMPNGSRYETAHFEHGKHKGLYTRWTPHNTIYFRHPYSMERQELTPVQPPLPLCWSQTHSTVRAAVLKAMRYDLHPLKWSTQPWLARIRATRDAKRWMRTFVLPRHTQKHTLRLLAWGEAKHKRMVDTAWIEEAQTGRFVWKMKFQKTQQAGNDPRNRRVDRILQLPPGRYNVHFVTDISHSPQQWISAPSSHPERYGITVYHTESTGYTRLLKAAQQRTKPKKQSFPKRRTTKSHR